MVVISIVAMNVNYYNVYSVIRIQLCTWTTNLQSTVYLCIAGGFSEFRHKATGRRTAGILQVSSGRQKGCRGIAGGFRHKATDIRAALHINSSRRQRY